MSIFVLIFARYYILLFLQNGNIMTNDRLTICEFDEGEFMLFGKEGDFAALTHNITPDLARCGVLEIIDRYLRPLS